MCQMLMVQFSGVYAWLKRPVRLRAHEDLRQTEMIQQAWADSGKAIVLWQTQSGRKYEQTWELPRQRRGRELLSTAKM